MYYATSVALETDVIIQRVSSNSTVPGKTPISATPFLLFLFLHLFREKKDSDGTGILTPISKLGTTVTFLDKLFFWAS